MYINNVSVFTVTNDTFNTSLLNKIQFLQKIVLITNVWMVVSKNWQLLRGSYEVC